VKWQPWPAQQALIEKPLGTHDDDCSAATALLFPQQVQQIALHFVVGDPIRRAVRMPRHAMDDADVAVAPQLGPPAKFCLIVEALT
jgi:hypothetical protein